MFRNLWEHIRGQMPKPGRGKGNPIDPLSMPIPLQTALDALYGHYDKTFKLWEQANIAVPPCFIIVCNNTATSKLVYDYIAGFQQAQQDGSSQLVEGRLPLFRNYDEHGNALGRPRTLLIDSEQLESGDALDDKFRVMAADEIERFRREMVERSGDLQSGQSISDQELLREAMNTVGKPGRLGDSVRCVVSVSMLTEGWDANTVTHVLGVRAFGTQLLCEQVIGRALRRQSYDLNEEGLFNVEYADVLGIPFDFTAKPVVAPPQPPRETIHVKAVRPERDALEIRFPRVQGYRVELPETQLAARFDADSVLELTPDLVGATETRNSGIIGETVDLNLVHTGDVRPSQVVYELTSYLLLNEFRDKDGEPKLYLFGQLKRIARQWLDGYLTCKGGTYRRNSNTRCWPIWPLAASSPLSIAPCSRTIRKRRSAISTSCLTLTTPAAAPPTSTSTPPRPNAGTPAVRPPSATLIGSYSIATGKGSSAVWWRPTPVCAPT
jgi:hypothetical protein